MSLVDFRTLRTFALSHSTAVQRAQELIRALRLQPHPEGGHYREIHRSMLSVRPEDGRRTRSALTLIYFLLDASGHSRWHRVTSDETWQHVEGPRWSCSASTPRSASASGCCWARWRTGRSRCA